MVTSNLTTERTTERLGGGNRAGGWRSGDAGCSRRPSS